VRIVVVLDIELRIVSVVPPRNLDGNNVAKGEESEMEDLLGDGRIKASYVMLVICVVETNLQKP